MHPIFAFFTSYTLHGPCCACLTTHTAVPAPARTVHVLFHVGTPRPRVVVWPINKSKIKICREVEKWGNKSKLQFFFKNHLRNHLRNMPDNISNSAFTCHLKSVGRSTSPVALFCWIYNVFLHILYKDTTLFKNLSDDPFSGLGNLKYRVFYVFIDIFQYFW